MILDISNFCLIQSFFTPFLARFCIIQKYKDGNTDLRTTAAFGNKGAIVSSVDSLSKAFITSSATYSGEYPFSVDSSMTEKTSIHSLNLFINVIYLRKKKKTHLRTSDRCQLWH